jgi:hypothetical protein
MVAHLDRSRRGVDENRAPPAQAKAPGLGERGDGAHRPVDAHLDRSSAVHEHEAQVGALVGGRDDHGAEHDRVAARFPHEGAADVAMAAQEVA